MLCNICGLNEANVNIIKIENGEQVEIHVCKDCIEGIMKEELESLNFFDEGINQVLSNVFKLYTQDIEVKDDLKCSNCNTSYSSFKKSGILGCSHCYENFREPLTKLIEGFHGSKIHKGKIPESADKSVNMRREEAILNEQLERAIEKEEYEEAAVIRDKLIEIRNK